MSIYSRCSEAAHKLMESPSEHGGVFTEIDVVRLAATDNWSTANYKEALRHSNQVVGTLYRARKLARFGPVILPSGDKDYARIASKVVYANADGGPKTWQTPNGRFKRLMIEDDNIGRQGRRRGTNRNDLEPWTKQDIKVTSKVERDAALEQPEETPVVQEPAVTPSLMDRLQEAQDRVRDLETQLEACQHEQGDITHTIDDRVLTLMGDFEERFEQKLADLKPKRTTRKKNNDKVPA